MRNWRGTWLLLPIATMAFIAEPREAHACGGCFVPPEENTQVTGHRMVFSIGADQSTLYDQIEYSGNPAEFAWVLPIKGTVAVGVSSDLLFNQLDADTELVIYAPPVNCPPVSPCPSRSARATP